MLSLYLISSIKEANYFQIFFAIILHIFISKAGIYMIKRDENNLHLKKQM